MDRYWIFFKFLINYDCFFREGRNYFENFFISRCFFLWCHMGWYLFMCSIFEVLELKVLTYCKVVSVYHTARLVLSDLFTVLCVIKSSSVIWQLITSQYQLIIEEVLLLLAIQCIYLLKFHLLWTADMR